MALWTHKTNGDIIDADHVNKLQDDKLDFDDTRLPYITPESKGAMRDGTTDDTAALQAAIVAGAAAKKPVLLSGDNIDRYLFTGTLTLYENTTIIGPFAGRPGASAYGATLFFQPVAAIPAFKTDFVAAYVGPIELRDFMLVGDGTFAYPSIGIDFTGGSGKIDIGIQGPFTDAGILLDGVIDTTVGGVINNFDVVQAMAAAILVKGTPWISTTTKIIKPYISGGGAATGGITDGIVCEGDAVLGLVIESPIIESLARYTFNFHKGNIVDIYSPYVENCPKIDAATPIIRLAKDTLGAARVSALNIYGGVIGGPNAGSAASFVMDIGAAICIVNIRGTKFERLKKFCDSAAIVTSYINIDGCMCDNVTSFGTHTSPETLWFHSSNRFNIPPTAHRLSGTYVGIPAYRTVSGQPFQATDHATNGIMYFWNGTAWVDAFGGLASVRDDAIHTSKASTSLRPGHTVSDTTAMAADVGGGIAFRGKYTVGGAETPGAAVRARKANGITGEWGFGLGILTRLDGSADLDEVARFTDLGNLSLGTTFNGANCTKTFIQKSGTAPTSGPIDVYQQYSADIAPGNAAPHFRTETGDIIKLCKVVDADLDYIPPSGADDLELAVYAIIEALKTLGLVADS